MARPLKTTGFLCPRCAARMDVSVSRDAHYLGQASVCRRRRCPQCRSKVTTYEVIDPDKAGDKLADLIDGLRRLAGVAAVLLRAYDAPSNLQGGNDGGT